MTRLEELLDSYWGAYAVWAAADADRGASEEADAAADAAWVAAWDDWIAYQAELKKTQKEQTND